MSDGQQEQGKLTVLTSEYLELRCQRDLLLEAAKEAVEIIEGIIEGDYIPDSFTDQTLRAAIASCPERSDVDERSESPKDGE